MDAAIAANEDFMRVGRQKKRRACDEDGGDEDDDVNVDSSSVTPWPEVHQCEFQRAGLEYKPCHKNEFSLVYQQNAFFRSLTPRCRECILFFDQTRPLTDSDAGRYPTIDVHDP